MALSLMAFMLGQVLAGAPVDTAAVAAASPRPSLCSATRGARRSGEVWEHARSPAERRYCADLARGYAALIRNPARSLEAAQRAEAQLSGQAAPLVLEARARFGLGDFGLSHERFEAALVLDPGCLGAPGALHDRARAAVMAGAFEPAARAYRQLVPRVGLMPSGAARRNALVEAGVLAMHGGPSGLDEAVGYLGEARHQPRVAGTEAFLLGALALALDRQGRVHEGRGVAAEAGGPGAVARYVELSVVEQGMRASTLPILPRRDALAIAAVLAEAQHSSAACDYWAQSLAAGGEAWAFREHAARKLTALGC